MRREATSTPTGLLRADSVSRSRPRVASCGSRLLGHEPFRRTEGRRENRLPHLPVEPEPEGRARLRAIACVRGSRGAFKGGDRVAFGSAGRLLVGAWQRCDGLDDLECLIHHLLGVRRRAQRGHVTHDEPPARGVHDARFLPGPEEAVHGLSRAVHELAELRLG